LVRNGKVQCWWAKAKLVCSLKFGEDGEKLKMAPRPCIYAEVLWINEQQFALGLFAGFTYVYQDILTKVLAKIRWPQANLLKLNNTKV
jgi:hypothetical protein